MTRYTIRFQHPDGSTQTVPNTHSEVIQSFGEKTIGELEASREDVYDTIDYVKEESEVELVDNDTDEVVWAGLLRDVVYEGSQAIISVDSYEQYAVNEEPIKNLVFSQLDDATIFRLLLSELDELSAGSIESVSDNISQSFSDVDHAKALDQIAGFGGGHPIYNEDKTVDYVESRGRDRPNTILAPRYDNVEFVRPDRQNRRAITHLRMLGDGIKVDVVSSDYTQGDPQRWTVNDDHDDVSDREKLKSLGEQELTRVTNNLDRVRVEVRDLELSLGDTLTVEYPEKDINRELHVTELTTVYDRGVSYKATLESQIVLGRPLEYDSDPSAWVSYRSSQRSRGYTSDAVDPEDRWTGQVVSTVNTSVGQTDPEVAISGDTVAVSSTFTSSDGTDTARLNVYDAQSGEERFEKNIDSGGEGVGCLIAGPYVVAASEGGDLEAYDKYTGDTYASKSTGYPFDGQPQHDDGTIYLPRSDDGTVVGFDLFDSLAEVYQTESVGSIARSPAIGDGRLYTVEGNGGAGALAAFSLDDGSEVWSADLPSEVTWSPAYFDDYLALQNEVSGTGDSDLFVHDATDGTQLWTEKVAYKNSDGYEGNNPPVPVLARPPELVSDSATNGTDGVVVYSGEGDGHLRIRDAAENPDNSRLLDEIDLDSGLLPPVAVAANRAYITSDTIGGVYVVNLSTGSTSQLDSPYSDMVVSPSVGSNVIAAVAHNSSTDREEAVVWYQEPEGAPSETQAGGSDETYDQPSGDTSSGEYINAVRVDQIDNTSGDDGGYANYTAQETGAEPGDTLTVEVDAETGGNTNYVHVVADWNRDYSFQDQTLVSLGSGSGSPVTLTGDITVPNDADIADVRLRVIQTRSDISSPPTEGDDFFGEIEDYTLAVVEDDKYYQPESRLSVSIKSVDSPVAYGDTATVEAEITNNAPFDEAAEYRLEVAGVGVDAGGQVSISGGGKETVTLQWDTSNGFPEPPKEGSYDWQACVIAEADGIPFASWGDCATVTVNKYERTESIYIVEWTDSTDGTTVEVEDANGTRSFACSFDEPGSVSVTPTEVTLTNTGQTDASYDLDGTEKQASRLSAGETVTVDMS